MASLPHGAGHIGSAVVNKGTTFVQVLKLLMAIAGQADVPFMVFYTRSL